jgi:hypothetical protein
MEVFYGERKTFQFLDGNNRPLANKTITLSMGDGDSTETRQTDAGGKAAFEILSVRHFKFGNSLENNGVAGTPDRIDYDSQEYTFSAEGYRPYTVTP